MKELDQIVLQKGLFVSVKGNLCLKKRHLHNSEGHVEVDPPLLLKKCPIPKSFIFLK